MSFQMDLESLDNPFAIGEQIANFIKNMNYVVITIEKDEDDDSWSVTGSYN